MPMALRSRPRHKIACARLDGTFRRCRILRVSWLELTLQSNGDVKRVGPLGPLDGCSVDRRHFGGRLVEKLLAWKNVRLEVGEVGRPLL